MSLKLCAHAGTPTYPKKEQNKIVKRWKRSRSTHTWFKRLHQKIWKTFKNPKHYRHLEHNPTTVNNATVNKALIRFKDE